MTMSPEQWRARARAAEQAIEAVLTEYADVVGPRECAVHGNDPEMCSPDDCAGQEIPSFLSEWIVVMGWNTKESGDNVITDVAPERSLLSHNIGLLRAATIINERDF